MNDTYVEVMVARKNIPLLDVGKVLLYILAVLCLIMGILTSAVFFIGAAAFAAVAYFVIPMFDLEYEYLYIDKEVSIDKIMSKEKRKHVLTLDLNGMEVMAPVRSHELDSYRARNLKTYDFTSNTEDAKVYAIACANGNEGTVLVNIEPNEEMLRAIKNVFPRKVMEV